MFSCTTLFILMHLVSKGLLNTHYEPGIMLGAEKEFRTDMAPAFIDLPV